MAERLGEVYPISSVTAERAEKYQFFLQSRQDFFTQAWEQGFFDESTVTLLLSPRMFGKTSFLNMLPIYLQGHRDPQIYSFNCLRSREVEGAHRTIEAMLENRIDDGIIILDEINYIVRRKRVWEKQVELAEKIWELKGLKHSIILTSSETSSRELETAYEALHPKLLRLPALTKAQTETIVSGVNGVLGKRVDSKLIDLVWQISGGIPPYIRSVLSEVYRLEDGELPDDIARRCMWRILDEPYALNSAIETLTNCPIEHSRTTEASLILMADQFCSQCPIGCRKSLGVKPIVEADLVSKYGLSLDDYILSPPMAFYFNDYLGRKQFSEFSENIVRREREIREYSSFYGKRELLHDARILLEIAYYDSQVLYEGPSLEKLENLLRSVQLSFLNELPKVNVLSRFIIEFNEVCGETIQGDLGIDFEAQDLKLSSNVVPINAYIQCKNWKSKINLENVDIFHKFEIVLRNAKQIHAAILISTSKIDKKMIKEALELTTRNNSVFCCWGELEISTIVSTVLNIETEKTLKAIRNLSKTMSQNVKFKGGALEYLTLKFFSAFTSDLKKH